MCLRVLKGSTHRKIGEEIGNQCEDLPFWFGLERPGCYYEIPYILKPAPSFLVYSLHRSGPQNTLELFSLGELRSVISFQVDQGLPSGNLDEA